MNDIDFSFYYFSVCKRDMPLGSETTVEMSNFLSTNSTASCKILLVNYFLFYILK